LTQPQSIKKIALFTDIHFGKKGNLKQHNQDCIKFIEWFCDQVKKVGDITHIGFLGDWFESRSAINIETLDFSYTGLELLNELGLPILFCVGNHDLHRRTTRDVHSVRMFNEMSNFTIIDKPTIIDNCLFTPYLFDSEYAKMIQHNDLWAWFGHFEFQGFALTGYNTILEHGPDPKLFTGPKKIFSGHFHKRQANGNICYIGNTFPMDFGDAGDNERGMAIYETSEDKVEFINWTECPKYAKVPLSRILAADWAPPVNARVKCVVDVDITYTDAQALREAMIAEYQLRDFTLEEDRAAKQGLLEGDTTKVEDDTSLEFEGVDELVISQLELALQEKAVQGKYDLQMIINLYKNLKVEQTAKD
jgi:DNA repair exonuclease SbcCD nuclease subunit